MRTHRIIIYRWIYLFKKDFMELLAGPYAESANAAALRGFAEKASATVDLAQQVFDDLDEFVRHYDNDEDVSAPVVTARNALVRAEGRLFNAQDRYGAAMDAHSSFLTARVEATRRLGAPDNRGKAADVADEEVSAPANAARNALVRADARPFNAQERYGAALDAHSSFLTARVEATRRLRAPDSRGKAAAATDEE